MRDGFFRKVPSLRDEFNHFYPSLGDFYTLYCLIREKVVTFRMVKLNMLLSIFLITK